MQTIYGVTSGENIVQAFTEENTTEANFHQSINNAAILTFTTTEPLKDGVRFFLTKDPINDYKNEEFMYFEITDQDFDGYEYTYRAEEYAYHDLDTMGYVKKIYNQGNWTTKSLLESITYKDVEPKGIARTKWEIIDNGITLPTTWAGGDNTYTLWYNTPLRGIEKFIEYFGGEIRFYVTIVDNKISRHYLEIYEKRGRETGKRYESNSNLISLTNKAEYSNRYEYIIPLAEGGGASGDEQKYNTPNGFNNYITLEGLEVGKSTDKWHKPKSQMYISLANDKNAYPLKTQPKGLQNNPRIKPVTFDEVKSKEALFDRGIEWLENNQGVAWSYSASVLDIGESQVGDTIAIIDERSGISSYVRVHDIDYDMIDPENTGVHFGSNWGYENDEAITDMVNTATSVKNDLTGIVDTAIRQSNDKNTNYYGINEPADPIEGDLWYWQSGDESGIKIYHNGNWVDLVDSNTVNRINEQVDKVASEAKTYADSLAAKQASEAATFQSEANTALSEAAAERNSLSIQADTMLDGANAYADSMAGSAAAYGKAQASNVLSQAQSELATAKQELGSEVSKAQSDITATNKQLAGKVSQTDFDKTTGDLSTKYGQVKATADSVKTDVSKYKETNDKKVSVNSASINTLNNQITSKVSQTDFDKTTGDLNGKFTQQQQTVDSISQTVTELQSKANKQGQVNQLMNTEFNPDTEGWILSAFNGSNVPYKSAFDKNVQANMVGFNTTNAPTNSIATLQQDVLIGSAGGGFVSLSWQAWAPTFANYANLWVRFYDNNNQQLDQQLKQWTPQKSDGSVVGGLWTRQKFEGIAIPAGSVKISVLFQAREGIKAYLVRPMLVFGETIGDYIPGNYNNNSRVSALEVSLDGITQTVQDPKNGLSATNKLASDGNTLAINAQNDATTAITTAKGVQTTVDDVQKDVKDLQSTTTQTAGQVTTEIEDRKSGDKSVVTQITGLIDQRVKDVEKGYESAISQSADTIMASVSTPNQLMNTEFNPDLEGWSLSTVNGGNAPYKSAFDKNVQANMVGFNTTNSPATSIATLQQDVLIGSAGGGFVSLSWQAWAPTFANYANLWVRFYDNNNQQLDQQLKQWTPQKSDGSVVGGLWTRQKFEGIAIPAGSVKISVLFQAREGIKAYLVRPMLVFDSTIGDTYMPGSYSGMNTSTVLELFKDNWALGIADNAGRLISGINGDTSGTVIQGKKIVVNGDTIFHGNNFMNAAVIKDGSIGTAKIGDLAVTSAKIKDLNVDKITGNVSSFIKSKWDGKYESVTIDSTGMTISVPKEQSVTKYTGDGIEIAKWNGSTAYFSATEWKNSTDEGLQIGIGDDSEFFSLGYQNRKDNVYYGKLIWGSPKAKTAPKGFTFDDSAQFNGPITVAAKQGSDGLTLFGNNINQLFGNINTTGNITLGGDLEFKSFGSIKIGDAGQNLYVGNQSFKNFEYPSIGNASNKFAGFAYGSTITYLLSDGTYYNATAVIKALDRLGHLEIPTKIRGDGTVAQWKTITI